LRVHNHARLAAQHTPDGVEREQRFVRRPLPTSFPNGYRIEFFPDLIRAHSTVARQNGWPGGDKERMEHGAGSMEPERIADFGLRISE
jgi:hypothetical protein